MIRAAWLLPFVSVLPLTARELPPLPAELSAYVLEPAPDTASPFLKKGDRIAICGDSITEQKLYSVLLESYLTASYPELEITCRQYGWSGEQAGGFLGRMKNDVLRFKPTVATTCYGMNDFRYVPYEDGIAAEYRKNQTAIVTVFQESGCRVVIGSPGIIDSVPHWVKSAAGTQQDLNLSLSRFRNINVEIAKAKNAAFADLYRPMLLADFNAEKQFGPDFKVAGKDGVHPAWAGQVIMAYGFLKGLGVDGNLGAVSYDETSGKATAANGHEVLTSIGGKITLRSTRLPFCPGPGATDKDDSIRAGMALVPFDDELNRFLFRVTSPKAESYTVTWGDQSRTYTAKDLAAGVNLAKDFDNNPLVPVFKKIWDAVSKKQEYETRQIKSIIHGPEGAADAEAAFALTEKARTPLEKAISEAKQPAEHAIMVTAVK
ncbi:SGNH/GDSL hydrolase family protein [Luteolibacter yonseiensis]|uniref:SGNH/GDSL hydrolase family protein n=1 Tax=Luteolibacter yonseiensis TaxID=1144680 RepID=A0A934R8U3_9BACT|nr:SGNH/GDSL hydrolase family protein [Luteolibacter yonseiensis]MBK1817590.1 SGNH/GDSL hydrolase family protein [Luteolibacter yonseiensis]